MSYPGGKNGAGVYQQIINLIPPHQRYIEPFLGGGAILRLKRPAACSLGIDADLDVVTSWKAMAANAFTDKGVDVGSRAHTLGNDDTGSRDLERSPQLMMAPIVEADDAAGYTVMHGDGIQFLRETGGLYGPETFIYCDPPYLLDTRKSGRLYRYELTREQHIELLDVLRSLHCPVMISGYQSDLYEAWLHDWHPASFKAMTRGGTMATEWLWANFPLPPPALHDYRYLGKNFRDRERIKRKTQRWKTRLGRMTPLERYALLQALSSE